MSTLDHSLLKQPRSSGILLHPTSLPGEYGIGTLGPEAERFLDFLADAGQRLWQVLPLGPTGYGDSPYQGFSAFAGNPLLIAVEPLVEAGLVDDVSLSRAPAGGDRVDFRTVIPWKTGLLREAFARFESVATSEQRTARDTFRTENRFWLDHYAVFMAIKEAHDSRSWLEWPEEYRVPDSPAVAQFVRANAGAVDYHVFVQWLFHEQWTRLHALARERGISIIGDIPIFVSLDSADVWANRSLFQLDETGRPTVVAGVPPDYFSETGQLWGNPIYDWPRHEQQHFAWWRAVLSSRFRIYDFVRVDHFRGFCAYWAVPYGEETAIRGEWIDGPGERLFAVLERELGSLPIVAEDLGVITPDVVELKESFGFPGMKVLQFGFDHNEANDHLPHGYTANSVVYTGTHDNETVKGWLGSAGEEDANLARRYLGTDSGEPHWGFIRGALASVSIFAVIPMQDLLGLGNEARMNQPGTLGGNWQWKMAGPAPAELAARLRDLTQLFGRRPPA